MEEFVRKKWDWRSSSERGMTGGVLLEGVLSEEFIRKECDLRSSSERNTT